MRRSDRGTSSTPRRETSETRRDETRRDGRRRNAFDSDETPTETSTAHDLAMRSRASNHPAVCRLSRSRGARRRGGAHENLSATTSRGGVGFSRPTIFSRNCILEIGARPPPRGRGRGRGLFLLRRPHRRHRRRERARAATDPLRERVLRLLLRLLLDTLPHGQTHWRIEGVRPLPPRLHFRLFPSLAPLRHPPPRGVHVEARLLHRLPPRARLLYHLRLEAFPDILDPPDAHGLPHGPASRRLRRRGSPGR